ncbi:MAG: hypothetical protein GY820_20575 [Gammaproteobacteria bacterium]|nr:hypothetical protein [Gammaproteobacteria bacterium]
MAKFASLKLKMTDFYIFANLGGKSLSDLTETVKNEIAMSDLPKKLSFAPFFSLHNDLPSTDGLGTPTKLAASTFFTRGRNVHHFYLLFVLPTLCFVSLPCYFSFNLVM